MLAPENLGEMVFEVVSMTVPALLNPKMTASWEKGLDGITQGTVDFWDYRTKLEDFIRTETEKMIGQDLREPLAERISNFAGKHARGAGARRKIGVRCPACGQSMPVHPSFPEIRFPYTKAAMQSTLIPRRLSTRPEHVHL